MVLGFSGKIGSGKSTVSSKLSNKLKWKYASFGNYVRKIAITRKLPSTREVLQELGEELIQRDIVAFCKSTLKEANWRKGDSIIIDGIRHVEVLHALNSLVKPDHVKLIFLALEEGTRQSRIKIRDVAMDNADKHSTERQVLNHDLIKRADLVLDSNLSTEAQTEEIISWLKTQS